jgi:mannose-1-phosphate guanylyltransferase / mannose-6-phosphate isomerase
MIFAKNLKPEISRDYEPGDRACRPWGEYEVVDAGLTKTGEDYCEKIITVNPGQASSLQSHYCRREHWTVLEGTLTVILEGRRFRLERGESIDIPLHSLHCLANLELVSCKVYERQEGLCLEEDIIRYADAYGRADAMADNIAAANSIERYNEILKILKIS